MPTPPRARPPGRNADLYADPKARADEIAGQSVAGEFSGYVVGVVEASRDTLGAVWDTFAAPIGDALTDVRKKLEEFFWGREVTAKEIDITREPVSAETRLGFHELMEIQAAMVARTPEPAAQARQEPEVTGPEM